MRRHGGGGFRVKVATYIYKHLDGTTRCGFGTYSLAAWIMAFLIFLFISVFSLWRNLHTYTEPHARFYGMRQGILYLASYLTDGCYG